VLVGPVTIGSETKDASAIFAKSVAQLNEVIARSGEDFKGTTQAAGKKDTSISIGALASWLMQFGLILLGAASITLLLSLS
jgi:hypothetical protein